MLSKSSINFSIKKFQRERDISIVWVLSESNEVEAGTQLGLTSCRRQALGRQVQGKEKQSWGQNGMRK